MSNSFDVVIVGAGIVGLATAMKLTEEYPRLKVAVVEKENGPASHQTGHNSGVIHSGVYYKPGSMKASMCIAGARKLTRFCEENGVPFEICGKVVVAVRPDEIPKLEVLCRRGIANGAAGMELIDPGRVSEIEPHVECLKGLLVPTTGIVDFRQVAHAYARRFQNGGGALFLNCTVKAVRRAKDGSLRVETDKDAICAATLINCAGLYADKVAAASGMAPSCRIVPFRGEYYALKPERRFLVKNLVYPVPDPRFPFLGVHFTRMLDGRVEAGPNAVLAWRREGYRKTDISLPELLEILAYPGFRRMAGRYWQAGLSEMVRSFSKYRYATALRHLVPEIRGDDLAPGGTGVRAQALGEDGALLDDFVILRKEKMVHVLNAPSPAATSSLAIAEHIIKVAGPFRGAGN